MFRSSIYDLELHSLHKYNLKSLDEALKCVLDNEMQGKPKSMKELNHLLKMNRKQIRGEFMESQLDQKSLSVVLPRIEELKRESRKMFLSVKFEFSRSYPGLYIPVVFQRPVSLG